MQVSGREPNQEESGQEAKDRDYDTGTGSRLGAGKKGVFLSITSHKPITVTGPPSSTLYF